MTPASSTAAIFWLTSGLLLLATARAPIESTGTAPNAAPSIRASLYAVGDIMYRTTSEGAIQVGSLMERLLRADPLDGRAILAGDICNDDGQEECYERLEQTPWGPLRPLLYPVPGNHDYQYAKGNGGVPYYFNYMVNAGARERGWYAFDWGGWRILGLNSEAMTRTPDGKLSAVAVAQLDWMDAELKRYANDRCVLTFYHRPMYSSGRFASPAWVGALFRKSYKYGVDLYFAGHEHMFASLPPLTPLTDSNGRATVDRWYGIPGIIGGTGGAILFPDPRYDPGLAPRDRRLKWSSEGEVVLANTWGVTRIDLWPGGYRWRFIPVDGSVSRVYPSGTGVCHSTPSEYVEPAN